MKLEVIPLSKLATVKSGGGAPQDSSAFTTTGLPFVRAGSLPKLLDGEDERCLERLEPEVAIEHGLNLFPAGTVLFAKSGMSATKGHVYRLKTPAYVVNHLAALIPHVPEDSAFLVRVLQRFSPTSLIKDAAYPSIRLGDIENMKVLAPLDSNGRRRIAEILDKADGLRASRRAALAQLDTLTQSIFLDMFGDPLAKDGDEEHVLLKMVTKRITYGFTCPMKHLDSGIPIVTAKNVREGFIDFESSHFADKSEFDALSAKSKPVRGDVLITKDGTIGRCAVVEEDEPFCINQSVALVRPDHSRVLPIYVVSYLATARVQNVMKNMGKGNALAHLQITELAELPMPLPTLQRQREFASRVAAVDEARRQQRVSLTMLEALVATLQHYAFRGDAFA